MKQGKLEDIDSLMRLLQSTRVTSFAGGWRGHAMLKKDVEVRVQIEHR